eukprot:TRINITY_DN17053_c0_g2_i1.p1 TRINITY_DN17053_c0_g2~~TRINITY_DN17053_c0_g2_i1.p1  ORF type:complete len:724 (+),score=201.56 TRINITY_DN17053_c0_g2_i1:100-2271(+)
MCIRDRIVTKSQFLTLLTRWNCCMSAATQMDQLTRVLGRTVAQEPLAVLAEEIAFCANGMAQGSLAKWANRTLAGFGPLVLPSIVAELIQPDHPAPSRTVLPFCHDTSLPLTKRAVLTELFYTLAPGGQSLAVSEFEQLFLRFVDAPAGSVTESLSGYAKGRTIELTGFIRWFCTLFQETSEHDFSDGVEALSGLKTGIDGVHQWDGQIDSVFNAHADLKNGSLISYEGCLTMIECYNHQLSTEDKFTLLSVVARPLASAKFQSLFFPDWAKNSTTVVPQDFEFTSQQFKSWARTALQNASDRMVNQFTAEMSASNRQEIMKSRQRLPLERRLLTDVLFNLIAEQTVLTQRREEDTEELSAQLEVQQEVVAQCFGECTGASEADILGSIDRILAKKLARERKHTRRASSSPNELLRLNRKHFEYWCEVVFKEFPEAAFRKGFANMIELRKLESSNRPSNQPETGLRRLLTKSREQQTREVWGGCGSQSIPVQLFGCVAEKMDSTITPAVLLEHLNSLETVADPMSPGSAHIDEQLFCEFVGWQFGKNPQLDFDQKLDFLREELQGLGRHDEHEEQAPPPDHLQKLWLQQAFRVKGLRRVFSLRGVDLSPSEMDDPESPLDQYVAGIQRVGFEELSGLLCELCELHGGPESATFWEVASAQLGNIGVSIQWEGPHLRLDHAVGFEHDWSVGVLHVCGGTLVSISRDGGGYKATYMGTGAAAAFD